MSEPLPTEIALSLAPLALILLWQGRTNWCRGLPLLHNGWRVVLGCLVVVLVIGGPWVLVILLTRWLAFRAPLVAVAAIVLSYLVMYRWLGHPGGRMRGSRRPGGRPPDKGAA